MEKHLASYLMLWSVQRILVTRNQPTVQHERKQLLTSSIINYFHNVYLKYCIPSLLLYVICVSYYKPL